MIIRGVSDDDLKELSVLFDAYRCFYHKPSDIHAAEIFLNERLQQNESVIFVAEEKTLAGFAQLYPLFSSTRMKRLWLLNDLFVKPDYRGNGISKLLIGKCFELARGTNACGVMLETDRSNLIGNQLYKRMGFELIESNFYFYENI